MASHDDEHSSGEETTSPQTEESTPSSSGEEESGESVEYSHVEGLPSSSGEEGDSGDVDFSGGGVLPSDSGADHSPGEGALPSEDSSSSAQDENYINNLILNIRALRSDVENSITLQSANIGQRELATSLLSVLEYGLENYAQSNFGCCQEICEIKTCYDPPQGYTSPEMLKKVSFLTNFSNIGIANIPDNAKFKIWWNSTENAMTRAFVDRYNVSLVNWLFEFFGLEKPTNKNLHGLTYAATAFLFYVVFGDPVLFLRVSEEFTQNKNVDKVLDLIAKDVFALEVNNWKDVLEDFNELLVAEAGSTPEASLQIQIDTIREVFVWIFENLQVSVNQLSENEACETVMGDKFPSYPGFLWVLVNTILAVVFSFFIAGSRAKFGLKGNGGRRWVPYFGPKDLDITGIEDPTTLSHFEQIFNDARSPFSGFSIKNVYWEESESVIVVQFNEEITDSTHPSTGSVLNPACYVLSKETADGPFPPDDVVPHAQEFDKVILSTTKITSWSDDLKLLAGSGTIGPTAALYNYDDEDGEDECSMWSDNWSSTSVGRPIGKNKNSYVGRTFSDIAAWAAESGDSISNIKISFEYLIDWHTRNFTPEFQEAFNVLQSIGWMNLKGSDFAGFLHPDAACGALIENLFCEYYDSIEKDCVKVDIEGSCGIFDCEETWEDTVTRLKDSIEKHTDLVLDTSDRLEAMYREREEIESERAESKQAWDSQKTNIEAEIESNNCNDSQDTTQCTELRTTLESINSEEAERQRVYDDWYTVWQAKVAELQKVIDTSQEKIKQYADEVASINNPRWSDICLYDGDAPTLEECTPIIEEAVQELRDEQKKATETHEDQQESFDLIIPWLDQIISCVQADDSDCLTTYPVPENPAGFLPNIQTLADLTGISDDDSDAKPKRLEWLENAKNDYETAKSDGETAFDKAQAEWDAMYALYAQVLAGEAPLTDIQLDCYGDRKPRSIVTKTDTSFYNVGTNDSQEAGLLFARKVNVATTYVHDTEADKFPTQGEAEARSEELGCTGYHQHGSVTVNSNDMYYMPCSSHEEYMAQVEKYTADQNAALTAAAASGDGGTSTWKLRAYNGTQTLCVEECVECSNDDINLERIEELKEIIENGTKETVKTRETTEDGCTLTDEEISRLCGEIKQLREGLDMLRRRGQGETWAGNVWISAPPSYAKYSSADAPDDGNGDDDSGATYNVASMDTEALASIEAASLEGATYTAMADVTFDSDTATTFNAVAEQYQSSTQLRAFSTDIVANLSSTFTALADSTNRTEEVINDLIREKEKQLEDAGCCCPLTEEDLRDLEAQKTQLSEAIVSLKTQVAKYDNSDNPNAAGRAATFSTILATLEAMVADIDQRIDSGEDCDNSAGSTTTTSWTVIEVSNDARRAITELDSLLSDCEDCGAWRIIRQGTDETFEGPECLIGWMYKDGDLQLDEARTANNAKFIVLEFKPENLLIDKRGDVYADGIKVARVALSGLIEYDFDGFYDQDLVTSMIHPRYIGNKRIFHVMQQGFHVMCHVPNSLRDELVRHEMIPYHIGTFFANRDPECHPEHAEAKDPCEIECCDPPELPDCVEIEIDGCAVSVPEWFKDWYARHKEYLYLKLPYDPRAHGDPNRYSKEEQIKFGEALIDFVISYFASTPFTPISGFESWGGVQNDMERVLNIFPVIKRPGYNRSKFKFADWIVGTNSNAPKISLPVELDDNGDPIECVDCCELIDSPCEPEVQFEDCCEGACGRWSADCEYETGDIVYSRDGVLCYKALIDICAGDCNPEPGMPAAEGVWELCSPDCENEPPVGCEFVLSNNCLDRSSSCDAKLAVGALYSLSQTNSCDYRWVFTATHVGGSYDDISVESFGRFPGEQESEDNPNSLIVIEIPLLPVVCQDDTDRTDFGNSWTFKLEAYSAEGNELLKTCFSERKEYNINCDFNIALWEGVESLKAEAYNWCEDTNSDNPQAKRQPAPNSEIGTKLEEIDNAFELVLSAEDSGGLGSVPHVDFQPIGTKLTELVGLVGAILDEDKLLELEASNASVGDRITQNMDEITSSTSDENKDAAFTDLLAYYGELKSLIRREEIYTGPEDCCCIIADPVTDTANDACELSWVWVVNSGKGGQIPYYAGKGSHATQSVLCAPRNPDEDQNTSVTVELFGYASTCDEIIQARATNWAGGDWDSDADGFNAVAVCSCSEQILIYCPCTPPDGLADVVITGCGDITSESYTDTEYKVNFTHVNEFNETCEVDWFWQINDLSPNGNTNEVAAGTGLAADNIQDHVLIPGRDYKIVLRWSKSGDHSVNDSQGGVAFEQEISIPECPRLDLNFDVNFSDTTYGQTSINTVDSKSDTDYESDMPFIGTVSDGENSSYNIDEVDVESGTNSTYWISVGDTDPYGSFTVSAQHNPDETDPKWQAVDVNDFDWKWTLSVEIDGSRIELQTQQTGAVDNKVPDFVSSPISSGSTPELSGDAHKDNNYSYTVELAAVDKSTNNKFDDEVKTETNTKHKGYRSVGNITTITPSVTPTSAVSATPEVYSIGIDSSDSSATVKRQITYKPMTDFAGLTLEKFNVEFEYGIGSTKENQEHTIEFTVANDPCKFIRWDFVSDADNPVVINYNEGRNWYPINAPSNLPADTSEIELEYEGTIQWELDDECGNLPANDHTSIEFTFNDMNPDCSHIGPSEVIRSENDAELTRNTNKIVGTFRFKHTFDLAQDESGNLTTDTKFYYAIILGVNATDNPIFVNLTDPDWLGPCFWAHNPYTVCWDGSYALTEECPCQPVNINTSTVSDTDSESNLPSVTVTPELNSSNPSQPSIDLSSFVTLSAGQAAGFGLDQGGVITSYPISSAPTISGSTLTLDASDADMSGDNANFTVQLLVSVWDTNQFATLAAAKEDEGDCVSQFRLNLDFTAGCVDSVADNYDSNYNISNSMIQCCFTPVAVASDNMLNFDLIGSLDSSKITIQNNVGNSSTITVADGAFGDNPLTAGGRVRIDVEQLFGIDPVNFSWSISENSSTATDSANSGEAQAQWMNFRIGDIQHSRQRLNSTPSVTGAGGNTNPDEGSIYGYNTYTTSFPSVTYTVIANDPNCPDYKSEEYTVTVNVEPQTYCIPATVKSSSDIVAALQTAINDATLTDFNTSEITISEDSFTTGDGQPRITLTDGTYAEVNAAGGAVIVNASDLFNFPAGVDQDDTRYTTTLTVSDNTVNTSGYTWNDYRAFNIRLGQVGGSPTGYARHALSEIPMINDSIATFSQGQYGEQEVTYTWTLIQDDCMTVSKTIRIKVEDQTFVAGCMDSHALNYDENAKVDNEQCCPTEHPQLNSKATIEAYVNQQINNISSVRLNNSAVDVSFYEQGNPGIDQALTMSTPELEDWESDFDSMIVISLKQSGVSAAFTGGGLGTGGELDYTNPNGIIHRAGEHDTDPSNFSFTISLNPKELFNIPSTMTDDFRTDLKVSRSFRGAEESYFNRTNNIANLRFGNQEDARIRFDENPVYNDDNTEIRYVVNHGDEDLFTGFDHIKEGLAVVDWVIKAHYVDCGKPETYQLKIRFRVDTHVWETGCSTSNPADNCNEDYTIASWQNQDSLCVPRGCGWSATNFWAATESWQVVSGVDGIEQGRGIDIDVPILYGYGPDTGEPNGFIGAKTNGLPMTIDPMGEGDYYGANGAIDADGGGALFATPATVIIYPQHGAMYNRNPFLPAVDTVYSGAVRHKSETYKDQNNNDQLIGYAAATTPFNLHGAYSAKALGLDLKNRENMAQYTHTGASNPTSPSHVGALDGPTFIYGQAYFYASNNGLVAKYDGNNDLSGVNLKMKNHNGNTYTAPDNSMYGIFMDTDILPPFINGAIAGSGATYGTDDSHDTATDIGLMIKLAMSLGPFAAMIAAAQENPLYPEEPTVENIGTVKQDIFEYNLDVVATIVYWMGKKHVVPHYYHKWATKAPRTDLPWHEAVGMAEGSWTLQKVKNWFRAGVVPEICDRDEGLGADGIPSTGGPSGGSIWFGPNFNYPEYYSTGAGGGTVFGLAQPDGNALGNFGVYDPQADYEWLTKEDLEGNPLVVANWSKISCFPQGLPLEPQYIHSFLQLLAFYNSNGYGS